jgi:hypothetical protein
MVMYGISVAERPPVLGWWACECPERPLDDDAWLHTCIEDDDPDRPGQTTGRPRPCRACMIVSEAAVARGDDERQVDVARWVLEAFR